MKKLIVASPFVATLSLFSSNAFAVVCGAGGSCNPVPEIDSGMAAIAVG
jgi:hypothetical protein